MPQTLILVESPNKARKLQEYLGAGYRVRASMGHICDLPEKDYGVDLETFEERYELRHDKLVRELRPLVAQAERVLLASDPDREGEAIAWHLARELRLPLTAPQRIEFREITRGAVAKAVAAPRPIDLARVDAQRSRRVIDRIVGWDVSQELCWPAGARSAGRVQTPALHILCVREREILAFEAQVYWTVGVTYAEGFQAVVPGEAGRRDGGTAGGDAEEHGADTAEESSPAVPPSRRPARFATREEAEAIVEAARPHPHVVQDVARRRTPKRPEPPYTTSTMQQDASRKLRLSAKQAADLAQQLFEAGYITYHRTDSTRVADDAVAMAREHIGREHPAALPATPPAQRVKAGAQDAHEAIRPTRLAGDDAPPPAAARLYAMIKARFLASQSKPALIERTSVAIQAGPVPFAAEGAVLVEEGYLVYWRPWARQEDTLLPALAVGQTLGVETYAVEEKKTTPPPRYDTGALIKKLESSGIGRPSTFASIIETLLRREYVQEIAAGRGKKVLQPTAFGLQVDALLADAMPPLVSEEYTAAMEAELDRLEAGDGAGRRAFLESWYREFRAALAASLPRAAAYRAEHGLRASRRPSGGNAEETKIVCDRCGEANYRKIQRKKAKGSFLACPACRMTRNVRAAVKPGACPRCGSALIERKGKKKGSKPFFGCVRWGAEERACDYVEWAGGRDGGTAAGSPRGPDDSPASQPTPAVPPSRREETDKTCPKCGAAKLVVLHPGEGASGAAAAPFYACDDRGCRFTLPVGARRRREPCPQCGGIVLERRRRDGGAFWACARYPACKYSADLAKAFPPAAPGAAGP
ncbi:MAG TPA: type I DNA topoisomerase [Gemmatimonadales bacterium]|nr:type I DNA topoisomerase [Gemmatimonadales bacterium]